MVAAFTSHIIEPEIPDNHLKKFHRIFFHFFIFFLSPGHKFISSIMWFNCVLKLGLDSKGRACSS
jgi:hypothetical protein